MFVVSYLFVNGSRAFESFVFVYESKSVVIRGFSCFFKTFANYIGRRGFSRFNQPEYVP